MTRPWDAARIAEARRLDVWPQSRPELADAIDEIERLQRDARTAETLLSEERMMHQRERERGDALVRGGEAILKERDELRAKLQRCDEIRLSQVRELRKQDGLIATLRDEINRLRRGLP